MVKKEKVTEKQTKKKQNSPKVEQNTEEAKPSKRKGKQAHKNTASDSLELFPNNLQGKYQDFGNLYNEINKSIEDSGKNDVFDVNQKKSELSERIQKACEEVFREEVTEAQKWIQDTQKSIQQQIDSLSGSYDKVRIILQETKAFNAEEMTRNLALLQGKIDSKKADLQTYKDLHELSKSIYS